MNKIASSLVLLLALFVGLGSIGYAQATGNGGNGTGASSVTISGGTANATPVPVSIASPIAVNTPAPAPTGAHGAIGIEGVPSGAPVSVGEAAVTGNGLTHYPATAVATSSPVQVVAGAITLGGVSVTWNVPTTATICWVTLYDSASAPTVGTGFIAIAPLVTSAPGVFAFGIPPTMGSKIVNSLWYAVSTTPTGSTACNTTANELWISADYK